MKSLAIEIAPGVEVVADLDRADRGLVTGVVYDALKALDFDNAKIPAFIKSAGADSLRRVLLATHEACFSEENLEHVDGADVVQGAYDEVLRIEAEELVAKAIAPAVLDELRQAVAERHAVSGADMHRWHLALDKVRHSDPEAHTRGMRLLDDALELHDGPCPARRT